MQGPLNLKYLVAGVGKEDWYKAWGTGIRLVATIIIIALLGLGGLKLWQFLFPKRPINENKPTINVGQGGISNYTVVQKSDNGWELGIFGGGLRLGDENGTFVGGEIRKRY